MTRNMKTATRARALRLGGAVGAGALVLGMITVGAAVAADSGADQSSSALASAKRSKEAAPASPKRSKEATARS